jgi:hypothetical protein
LNARPNNGPSEIRAGLTDGAFEAHKPRTDISSLGGDERLVFMVCDNFRQFIPDVVGVGRLSADVAERVGCPVELSFLDEITRGLGWRLVLVFQLKGQWRTRVIRRTNRATASIIAQIN